MTERSRYVHGYTVREEQRLCDQAQTLAELLHHDSVFGAGERVLEAGCGTGAQTKILASRNRETSFTSIDLSPQSLAKAHEEAMRFGLSNVDFHVADVYGLPFDNHSFDHGFVCFLLEHLKDPEGALAEVARVVRPGGTVTVIEGDHGSTYFYPEWAESRRAVEALVRIQEEMGGNSLIGRQLYPLLCEAGLDEVTVSPRMVYVDKTRPELVQGFIRDTFTAMVEGVRGQAILRGLLTVEEWEKGIRGLLRTAEPDGVFCYTFFKAIGTNPDRFCRSK
jgi:SAM-dependent methyltransferase